MKHTTIIVAIGLALTAALSAAPAYALAYHTFVSPTGSDSNPCTLALPCRNLQAALNQTTPGGEIAILGTAGYSGSGTLTIDRAISIVNTDAYEARISPPSGGIGIVINAGVGDAVSLRGLTIDGAGVGNTGIQFNSGASLTIENCIVRHMTSNGLNFLPNATSRLTVSNSLVADNGNNGVYITPSGSGTVTVVLSHAEVNNNLAHGVNAGGLGSTGIVNITVADSVAAGNGGTGFVIGASPSTAPTTLMLFHSISADNNTGIAAQGTGAIIRIFNSMITGNSIGWETLTYNGTGVVQSYGNNSIDGNVGNETAPPSIGLK